MDHLKLRMGPAHQAHVCIVPSVLLWVCGPSWAVSSVDVAPVVVGDISLHVFSTFLGKKYFSNRCYCFCKSPPFVFEVWWNFPAGRTAVCPDSPPEFLMCTQGLCLMDLGEFRGGLAVPVVAAVVDPALLVRPRDAIGQLL